MSTTVSQPFIRHQDLPSDAVPVVVDVITLSEWERYSQNLTEAQLVFAKAHKFTAEAGQRVRLPEADGRVKRVLFGLGEDDAAAEMRLGSLGGALPAGFYKLGALPGGFDARLGAIGWGMGAYRFDRYLTEKADPPILAVSYTHLTLPTIYSV